MQNERRTSQAGLGPQVSLHPIPPFASIQEDDLIPKEIRVAFEKARQSADVMPKNQLEKVPALHLSPR